MYEDILCVIPARGGSKGIPGKNKKLLAGIPLVLYSIQYALSSGIPKEQIIVSSDDEDILEMACERNRVVALDRPMALSGDSSSTDEVLLHVINDIKDRNWVDKGWISPIINHVLLLQPTSPIRFIGTIQKFISFYLDGGYTSALTGTEFHPFTWTESNGSHLPNYDPTNRPMRQQLHQTLFENGNMYITQKEALMKTGCRLAGKIGVCPISYIEGLQIDTQEEFDIAEIILQGEVMKKCLSPVKL